MGVRVALCALIWLSSATALAQDREVARQAFEEAERQYEQGNHALALEGFERAYQLMRSEPRGVMILYNVGQCQRQLGRVRDAIQSFETYLAGAPDDAPFRDTTQDLLRDLRARVANEPEDAPPAETRATPAPDGIGPLEISGLVVAAVGVAAALVAIPTGVMALDGEAQLVAACGDGGPCSMDEQGLLDQTRTMALVTDVLWIGGLSLAAVGATLFLIGVSTRPSFQAAAFCTGVGCVGSVSARF